MKRHAELVAGAPFDMAVPDRVIAVEHEIEVVRNAELAFDGQAGAGVGQVAHRAVGACAEPEEGDLRPLQHFAARCAAMVGRTHGTILLGTILPGTI